jgi:hypothetical protein
MKRDMDLVRDLLLRLESVSLPNNTPATLTVTSRDVTLPGDDPLAVTYHLRLLVDAGFVEATNLSRLDFFGVKGLTWRGHDFLDSVRDLKIWHEAKEGATKAGGFTVDLLFDLAKGLLKTQIEKHTGVKL